MPRFLLVITFLTSALCAQQPSIEVQLQSSFLVEREETLLSVTVRNLAVNSWPESPVVSPLSLRQQDYSNMIINGQVSKSFSYALSGLRPGVFQIPPFRIGNITSNSLSVTILDKNNLKKGSFAIDGKTYPLYSATLIQNDRPYLGQTQPIEAKIYLPREFRVERLLFADFQKGNFVAWRFDPAGNSFGAIRLDGQIFSSFAYRSSITPLEEGPQEFGPGKVSPLLNYRVARRGGFYWARSQVEFNFPGLSLDVRPLPKPAPTGFSGAVGNFSLTSKTAATEVTVGDSLTVEIAIAGTGNLDQLSAPQLIDNEEVFKEFDTSKKPQGSDRRSSSGTVEFSQLIRPQKVTSTVPAYELQFFDPILEQYQTALSKPIPLTVKPGAAPPSESTGPLADSPLFLTPGSFVIPAQTKSPPVWLWQIIPALIALYLISQKLFPKFRKKQKQSLIQKEFNADLGAALEASDRPELYRRAARLIERWPANADDPEIERIIATRDEICFSPASECEPTLPKERSALQDLLQRLAPVVLLSALLIPTDSHAEDWKSVIEETPTPEAFHNLALIEKAAGNPAVAALYLYRYQAYSGDPEPLSGLLSQTGGYRLREPIDMEYLAVLPRSFYNQVGIAALWAVGISILLVINRKKVWLGLLVPIMILAGILWGLAWRSYPDDISFKPLTELSVLMESTKLLDAPYEGAPSKAEIPATSPGFIRGTNGTWANVEFPGGSIGWVPRQVMAPIQGRNLWNPPSQKD